MKQHKLKFTDDAPKYTALGHLRLMAKSVGSRGCGEDFVVSRDFIKDLLEEIDTPNKT